MDVFGLQIIILKLDMFLLGEVEESKKQIMLLLQMQPMQMLLPVELPVIYRGLDAANHQVEILKYPTMMDVLQQEKLVLGKMETSPKTRWKWWPESWWKRWCWWQWWWRRGGWYKYPWIGSK